MSDFFLLELPVLLVEKVIAKTDPKSNFRLRQTCRTVQDLIKASTNITTPCDGSFSIKFKNSNFELSRTRSYSMGEIRMDEEGFYGCRMRNLWFSSGMDAIIFPLFYEYLRHYRLACEKLHFGQSLLSKVQYSSILKVVKPVAIEFSPNESNNLMDAVFDCKTLRRVAVFILPGDALAAMKNLLPHFPDIDIQVMLDTIAEGDILPMLSQALNILLLTPPSANTKFRFRLFGEDRISRDELKEAFPVLQWRRTLIEDEYGYVTDECVGVVQLPSNFPQHSTCKIVVDYDNVDRPVTYELQYDLGKPMQ